MGDDALRFEVLGPVRAYRGGDPVDVGPRNQQAVLGLLLLRAGQPVSIPEIIGVLWSTDPPENGEDIVLRYIGALRRILDPHRTSLIAFTDGGYVLRAPEGAVDTGVFRAAVDRARDEHRTGNVGEATGEVRRVLENWRAEPLTGLSGPVFDAARAKLGAERATAAELVTPPAPTPAPTRVMPNQAPMAANTRAELAKTMIELAPAREQVREPVKEPVKEPAKEQPQLPKTRIMQPEPDHREPDHPEPVDPWDGHDLFPPDPLSIY